MTDVEGFRLQDSRFKIGFKCNVAEPIIHVDFRTLHSQVEESEPRLNSTNERSG